jgi:hypothetical protein
MRAVSGMRAMIKTLRSVSRRAGWIKKIEISIAKISILENIFLKGTFRRRGQ